MVILYISSHFLKSISRERPGKGWLLLLVPIFNPLVVTVDQYGYWESKFPLESTTRRLDKELQLFNTLYLYNVKNSQNPLLSLKGQFYSVDNIYKIGIYNITGNTFIILNNKSIRPMPVRLTTQHIIILLIPRSSYKERYRFLKSQIIKFNK